MVEAKEKFITYLKSDPTHRITPERFEVMDAALNYDGHFAADELYIFMKQNNSHVSRATVYNTLELLEKCNLLAKRNFGDKTQRYESIAQRNNHDHLICSNCGRVAEFHNPQLNEVISEVADKLGFEFSDYSINIFVKCKDSNCRTRNEHSDLR